MATKQYQFVGPVKWAKVWPGQLDTKFAEEAKGGNWSVVINLGDQLQYFNGLGTKTKAARLDDPERGISKGDVTFRRYERHPRLGTLGPPVVEGVTEGTAIGNGSIGEVTVDVYDYPQPDGNRGFAIRLAKLVVHDLVPYIRPDASEAPVD